MVEKLYYSTCTASKHFTYICVGSILIFYHYKAKYSSLDPYRFQSYATHIRATLCASLFVVLWSYENHNLNSYVFAI